MKDMGEFCPSPETLSGWLEHSLAVPERGRVTAHLASCDDCRRSVAIASSVEPKTGGAVDETLLRQVVELQRRRPWTTGRWVAWAAAGVFAVGLGFWMTRAKPEASAPVAKTPPGGPEEAPVAIAPVAAPQPRTPAPTPPPPVPAPAPEAPAPVVEPKPEPPPRVPSKEEPKKPLAAEEPVTPPPAPKEAPAPAPVRPPGRTEADLSGIFATLFVVDPSGDLWITHDGGEPVRVGRTEPVGVQDTISARDSAGAFALEGKATMALEKGASATVAWQRVNQAYTLNLVAPGGVMVDTEGMAQKWEVHRGSTDVALVNVNGRFVVEPRGDQLAAVLLAGRGDLRVGATTRPVDAGRGAREVTVAPDGRITEKTADAKKYARLGELRPSFFTVFSATFEKDEVRAFPYTVTAGRLVTEGSRTYLHAEVPSGAYPKSGEKLIASCSVKPERPVVASDRIVLGFWYRSTVPTFTIKLGKYQTVYTSRLKAGEWGEGRIQVSAFDFEGTAPNSGDDLTDVQFQAAVDGRKVAILDVDGVQFLRRAK